MSTDLLHVAYRKLITTTGAYVFPKTNKKKILRISTSDESRGYFANRTSSRRDQRVRANDNYSFTNSVTEVL